MSVNAVETLPEIEPETEPLLDLRLVEEAPLYIYTITRRPHSGNGAGSVELGRTDDAHLVAALPPHVLNLGEVIAAALAKLAVDESVITHLVNEVAAYALGWYREEDIRRAQFVTLLTEDREVRAQRFIYTCSTASSHSTQAAGANYYVSDIFNYAEIAEAVEESVHRRAHGRAGDVVADLIARFGGRRAQFGQTYHLNDFAGGEKSLL